tara:strand:+ start:574 stop:1119 length:546 start_codon:yes stop_codon:yes gene_type:complete
MKNIFSILILALILIGCNDTSNGAYELGNDLSFVPPKGVSWKEVPNSGEFNGNYIYGNTYTPPNMNLVHFSLYIYSFPENIQVFKKEACGKFDKDVEIKSLSEYEQASRAYFKIDDNTNCKWLSDSVRVNCKKNNFEIRKFINGSEIYCVAGWMKPKSEGIPDFNLVFKEMERLIKSVKVD